MDSLENVKVGDTLFVSNGVYEYLEVVTRITKTLVITHVHRFNRGSGKLCGSEYWDVLYARLATDEDVAMIRRKQMIRRCEDIDFSLLTFAQLEKILEIVDNHVKLD